MRSVAAALLGYQFRLWTHPGHPDYLQGYARVFKRNHDQAIPEAKREAQRAVDYLLRAAAGTKARAA
jgi:antirestriction protein ArdC